MKFIHQFLMGLPPLSFMFPVTANIKSMRAQIPTAAIHSMDNTASRSPTAPAKLCWAKPNIKNTQSKAPHSKLWGITGRGTAPPQVTDEAPFIPPSS